MPDSHTNIFATGPSGIRDSIDFAENLRDHSSFDDSTPDHEPTRSESLVAALRRRLLFRKLAVFAKVYETDDIIPRLPVFALAKLSVLVREPGDDTVHVKQSLSFTLGSLATDHVGYASFDLRPLQDIRLLLALSRSVPDNVPAEDVNLEVTYRVLPFADDQFAIDAEANGDVSDGAIVLRLHLAASWLVGRESDPALPSMQDPGIQDWRYSPGSFAVSPARLIGDGSCEDLYPSDLSTHQFAFHQAVQVGSPTGTARSKSVVSVRFGYLLDFRTQWFPVGHSLGRVLYSLPLAPGEKVKLAIIDWNRADSASRDEQTSTRDELFSDQHRDRSIGEIVRSSVRQKQSGHSIMGGTGTSVVVPVASAIIGGSLGLGASKKSSKGYREVAADTTQNLSDGFRQASTAVRELNSTVVTQVSQSEQGRFETRQVANHNHCHTLTILYYEVLRHYRTMTSFVRRRPVLFVQFAKSLSVDLTTEEAALAYRAALEPALLDSRYAAGFDAVNRVQAAKLRLAEETARMAGLDHPPEQPRWSFSQLTVLFHTGNNAPDKPTRFSLVDKGGDIIPCRQVHPEPGGDPGVFDTNWRDGGIDAFVVAPERVINWSDLSLARIDFQANPAQPVIGGGVWRLDRLEIIAMTLAGDSARLISDDVNHEFSDSSTLSIPVAGPTNTLPDLPPILTDHVSAADIAARNRLLQHLGEFSDYYGAVAFASSDPIQRLDILRSAKLGDTPIAELVENRVAASEGLNLAFPLTDEQFARDQLRVAEDDDRLYGSAISVEDLISVPTKGVFADGKLGHCSTCEKIDDTRFWDFQKSPIPGDAPEISPVSSDTRFQTPQNLAATAFPASLINMASPAPAPDPVAMAAALKLLGSGDVFRDMSGGTELANYLTSLVQGTQGMVNAMGGNRRQSELLDQILNNPNLDAEQKTTLARELLNNGGTDVSKQKGSSQSGTQSDGGTSGASQHESEDGSQPNQVGSPGRARKPAQAKSSEPALILRFDTDTQSIPAKHFTSKIFIHPAGQASYGSTNNPRDFISTVDGETILDQNSSGDWIGQVAVRLHDGTSRTGNIELLAQLNRSVEVSGFSDKPGLKELIEESLVGYNLNYYGGYSFPDGDDELRVTIRFHYTTRTVGGETWSAARAAWEQETVDLAFRQIVRVFATDFSDGDAAGDPGDRTWTIGYLADKPTISVGPME